jgi:hypothetical protein
LNALADADAGLRALFQTRAGGRWPQALADSAPEGTLKLILTVPDPAAALPKIAALGGKEIFRERGPLEPWSKVELPGSELVPLARLPEGP